MAPPITSGTTYVRTGLPDPLHPLGGAGQATAPVGPEGTPGAEAAQTPSADQYARLTKDLNQQQKDLLNNFKSLGLDLNQVLDEDGNVLPEKLARIQKDLEGKQFRSLNFAAKGVKLPKPKAQFSDKKAAALQSDLIRAAYRNSELPLLSLDDQEKALKAFIGKQNLSREQKEALLKGLKRALNQAAQGWTGARKLSHLATLKGRELHARGRLAEKQGQAQEGAKLQEQAAQLHQAAIEMDPGNADSHRYLALRNARAGKLPEARSHFAQALQAASDPAVIRNIAGDLGKAEMAGLLRPGETPEMFVGDQLVAAGRYPWGKAFYRLGMKKAGEGGEKYFRERLEWVAEKENPYQLGFTVEDNKHAAFLFQALKNNGIPPGMIKGGEAGGGERKLSPEEIFAYAGANFSDPRVQAAIREAHLDIPAELYGKIPNEGLAKVMGDYHLSLAKAAKEAGASVEEQRNHLINAGNYLTTGSEAAQVHTATGDLYLSEGKSFEAVQEYLQANQAEPLDPQISAKLSHTLNKAIPETVKAAEEKMKVGDYQGAKALLAPMVATFYNVASNAILAMDSMLAAHGEAADVNTPQNFRMVASASEQLGRIMDSEGKHEEAVQYYQGAVYYANRGLTEGVAEDLSQAKKEDAGALMVRSNAQLMLGEFGAAHADAKRAAELDSKFKVQFEATVKTLEQKAEQFAKLREGYAKENPPDFYTLQGYLTHELQIHEALGHQDKVKELSPKLKEAMVGSDLGPIREAVLKMAAQGLITAEGVERFNDIAAKGPLRFLDPAAPTRVSDYVIFEESGGKTKVKFNEAFDKLNPGQQFEVMLGLKKAGMRASFARLAAEDPDPLQRRFFQTQVDSMDGNIPAARVGLMELRDETRTLTDPQGKELHQQVRRELRKLSLGGLKDLRNQLEGLKEARELRGTGLNKRERVDYELERLGKIESMLNEGSIDTVDEGLAIIAREESLDGHGGVSQKGERLLLRIPQPRKEDKAQEKKLAEAVRKGTVSAKELPTDGAGPYGNIPRVRLQGGTVDVPTYHQGGPSAFAVVVGKEGGTINLAGRAYSFHPSDEERVVLFQPGFQEYNRSNVPPNPTGVKAYQYGFSDANARPQDIPDAGYDRLLALQTRAGLEKIKTPEGKNQQLLEAARALRQSNDFALAGQIFEAVIADEVEKGYAKISPERYQEIKRQVEGNEETVEQARERVEEIKKDPAGYQAQLAQFKQRLLREKGPGKVPEGAALEKAFLDASIQAAKDGKLGLELKKAAMEEVGKAHEAHQIGDSTVATAWAEYDNMMDPTGNNWAPSDEAWNAMVQQTVVMAAISVVTLGAGTAIQAGLAGTRLALGIGAMSTAGRAAVGVGIYLARNTGEALVQTGLEYSLLGQQFTASRFGYNLVNQMAFHGVMGAWAKTGGRLGEKAAGSLASAAERGVVTKMQEAVLGTALKGANVAGMIGVQATIGTVGTYAEEYLFDMHHPGGFWERWKDSAKHMAFMHFGMHGLNVMTGNRAAHAEALARGRLDKAREVYSDLRSRGFKHPQALERAIDGGKALKIDGHGRLYTNGAGGQRIYELPPGQSRALAVDQEAELQKGLDEAAAEETPTGERPIPPRSPTEPSIQPQEAVQVAIRLFGLENRPLTPKIVKKAYHQWLKDNPLHQPGKKNISDQSIREERFREAKVLYEHLMLERFGEEATGYQPKDIAAYLAGKGPTHLYKEVTGREVERAPHGEGRIAGRLPASEVLKQAPIRTMMDAFGIKADDATVARWTKGLKIDPTRPEFRETLDSLKAGIEHLSRDNVFSLIRDPRSGAVDLRGPEGLHQIKQALFQEVLAGHLGPNDAAALGDKIVSGQIGQRQLTRALGFEQSAQKIHARELQLGLGKSQWLKGLAEDPAAFNKKLDLIEKTEAQINARVMNCVLKGRIKDRADFKNAMMKAMGAIDPQGHPIPLDRHEFPLSTDTGKAVDSMIDIVDTGHRAGIIDQPGGISRAQMVDILTTLYLNGSPAIRLGGAELTHVPMVVQGTVDFRAAMPDLAGMSPAQRTSEIKKAFVTSLLHDAGKWDVNLKTTEGFQLLEFSGEIKGSNGQKILGADGEPVKIHVPAIDVPPGKTLQETLAQLQQEGKLTEDQVKAVGQNRSFMVPIIAHHESLNVRRALNSLKDQGIVSDAEVKEIWAGIERHALVSSWIVSNSKGGFGVKTQIIEHPDYQRFLHGYVGTPETPGLAREIQSGAIGAEQLDLLLNSKDPAGADLPKELRPLKKKLTALREDFHNMFSENDRAMMLGDHRGQVDPFKYVLAVINSPANAKAKAYDLLLGGDLNNNVVSVIKNHLIELKLLDPAMALQVEGSFTAGMDWMRNLNPAQAGLGKALKENSTTQKMIADQAGVKADAINGSHIEAWLKGVDAKTPDGKMSPELAAIHKAFEKPFYDFYALNPGSKEAFRFGAPFETVMEPGLPANDNMVPEPPTPPHKDAIHPGPLGPDEGPATLHAPPLEGEGSSAQFEHPMGESLDAEAALAGLRGKGDVYTRLATEGVDVAREKHLRTNLELGYVNWRLNVPNNQSLIKFFTDALGTLRAQGEAGRQLAAGLQRDFEFMQTRGEEGGPGAAEAKVAGGRLKVLMDLKQRGELAPFINRHGTRAEQELNLRGHLERAGGGEISRLGPEDSVLEQFENIASWLQSQGGEGGQAMARAISDDVAYMSSRDVEFRHEVENIASDQGDRLNRLLKAQAMAERLPADAVDFRLRLFEPVYGESPSAQASTPAAREGATVPPPKAGGESSEATVPPPDRAASATVAPKRPRAEAKTNAPGKDTERPAALRDTQRDEAPLTEPDLPPAPESAPPESGVFESIRGPATEPSPHDTPTRRVPGAEVETPTMVMDQAQLEALRARSREGEEVEPITRVVDRAELDAALAQEREVAESHGAQTVRAPIPEPPPKTIDEAEIRRGLDVAGRDVDYLLRLDPENAELQGLNQRIAELEGLDHPGFRQKSGSQLAAHGEEFLDIQRRVDARRMELSLSSAQHAEAVLSQSAPEVWAAFRPFIELAKEGRIPGHTLQRELAKACSDGFVQMAQRQMGLAPGEALPTHLEMALDMVAEGFVDTGLISRGLKPETVRDFIGEAVAMYQSVPSADQQGLFAFGFVPTPFTPHNFLGTRPTADSQMQMITQNLRGYRKLFGDQAGIVFSGQGRLLSEIKDPEGHPSGFHLAVERGQFEGHSGLRLAVYEGTPDPGQPYSATAQVQLNFGPEGTLQVVNMQGPHTRMVSEQVAKAGSLDRFGQIFEKGQPLDLLLATAMLMGRNAGYQKMEGIAGRAQRALRDQIRLQEKSFDPGQNLYDGTFARFGFKAPEGGGDYWSMDLNRLEIHRQIEPARHRESPGVPRGERPFLPTVGPNSPADYFRQVLVRPNRADTVSDKRYKEWDRKIPRGTKDAKGNIKPGPVTEQVQNFWKGFAGAMQNLSYQEGPSKLPNVPLPEGNPLAFKRRTLSEVPQADPVPTAAEPQPTAKSMTDYGDLFGFGSPREDVADLLRLNPQDPELKAINQRIIELERLDDPETRKEAGEGRLAARSEELLDLMKVVEAKRLQFFMDSVQQAGAALAQAAPKAWAEFQIRIDKAKRGEIPGHELQLELTDACREGFVEMAHQQMGLDEGQPLPPNLKLALETVSEGIVQTGLVARGLKPETVQDFISEVVEMYRSVPQADEQRRFAFSLVPTLFNPHNFLGTKPTADSQMQMITHNLRGYRRLFGGQAGVIFSGQGRLVREINKADGNPSGFHLAIERGQHEGHSGLRLAIYEGTPDPKDTSGYTSQLQINFGPEGTLQVINLQGPSTHPNPAANEVEGLMGGIIGVDRRDERFLAKEGSLERFGQSFEKSQPLDLLLATAMLMGRNAGYQRIEGITGSAQTAYQDLLRSRGQEFDPGRNLYDGTFARFGFKPPAEGSDYWSMDLGRLEIHRQNEPTRHRESPGVRRGERPFLPTVGPNSPADYFRQVLVRPNRADTVSDKRYKEWDRKIPRGTKDPKGNIKPGPVTEQVQNFWKGFAGALQNLSYQEGPSKLPNVPLPEGNPLAFKRTAAGEASVASGAEPVAGVAGRAHGDTALARAIEADYRALESEQRGPALQTELASQTPEVQAAYARHESAFGRGVIVIDRVAEFSKHLSAEKVRGMVPEKARYMLQERKSGAGTTQGRVATQDDLAAYQLYQKHYAWPDEPPLVKDAPQLQDLQSLGNAHGLQIETRSAVTPTQADYIQGILSDLPPELLNTPYLRGVHIGTQRVGPGKMSSFQDGVVNLYVGTLEGPRRNLVGLLLHEIGHSSGERYGLEEHPRTHGQKAPDPEIPRKIREQMHRDHELITAEVEGRDNQAFALDWMGGKQYRKNYVVYFEEFIAEFHVHYVANGDALRAHIDAIADPVQKGAYQRIYQEMRSRVFGGREYGAQTLSTGETVLAPTRVVSLEEAPTVPAAPRPEWAGEFEPVPAERRRLSEEEIPAEARARQAEGRNDELSPATRPGGGEFCKLTDLAFRQGQLADVNQGSRMLRAHRALKASAREFLKGLGIKAGLDMKGAAEAYFDGVFDASRKLGWDEAKAQKFGAEVWDLVRSAVESGRHGKPSADQVQDQARELLDSYGPEAQKRLGHQVEALVGEAALAAYRVNAPLPSHVMEGGRVADLTREALRVGAEGKSSPGESKLNASAKNFLDGVRQQVSSKLADAFHNFFHSARRESESLGWSRGKWDDFSTRFGKLVERSLDSGLSGERRSKYIQAEANMLLEHYGLSPERGLGKQAMEAFEASYRTGKALAANKAKRAEARAAREANQGPLPRPTLPTGKEFTDLVSEAFRVGKTEADARARGMEPDRAPIENFRQAAKDLINRLGGSEDSPQAKVIQDFFDNVFKEAHGLKWSQNKWEGFSQLLDPVVTRAIKSGLKGIPPMHEVLSDARHLMDDYKLTPRFRARVENFLKSVAKETSLSRYQTSEESEAAKVAKFARADEPADSPANQMAGAAKAFLEGEISHDAYQQKLEDAANQLINDHSPSFQVVSKAISQMAAFDQDGRPIPKAAAEERPPVTLAHSGLGRMKDPMDIVPKVIRRGWSGLEPFTDFAGVSLVIKSGATDNPIKALDDAMKGLVLQVRRNIYESFKGKLGEAEARKLANKVRIRDEYDPDGTLAYEIPGKVYEKGELLDRIEIKSDIQGENWLTEGRDTGYRARHMVLEVPNGDKAPDGSYLVFPNEVQGRTDFDHEWNKLQHGLVLKSPLAAHPELEGKVGAYCKKVSDYLAIANGLIKGELPKTRPTLDAETRRAIGQEGLMAQETREVYFKKLEAMAGLMDKYAPRQAQPKAKGKPPPLPPARRQAPPEPLREAAFDAGNQKTFTVGDLRRRSLPPEPPAEPPPPSLKPGKELPKVAKESDTSVWRKGAAKPTGEQAGRPGAPEARAPQGSAEQIKVRQGYLRQVLSGKDGSPTKHRPEVIEALNERIASRPDLDSLEAVQAEVNRMIGDLNELNGQFRLLPHEDGNELFLMTIRGERSPEQVRQTVQDYRNLRTQTRTLPVGAGGELLSRMVRGERSPEQVRQVVQDYKEVLALAKEAGVENPREVFDRLLDLQGMEDLPGRRLEVVLDQVTGPMKNLAALQKTHPEALKFLSEWVLENGSMNADQARFLSEAIGKVPRSEGLIAAEALAQLHIAHKLPPRALEGVPPRDLQLFVDNLKYLGSESRTDLLAKIAAGEMSINPKTPAPPVQEVSPARTQTADRGTYPSWLRRMAAVSTTGALALYSGSAEAMPELMEAGIRALSTPGGLTGLAVGMATAVGIPLGIKFARGRRPVSSETTSPAFSKKDPLKLNVVRGRHPYEVSIIPRTLGESLEAKGSRILAQATLAANGKIAAAGELAGIEEGKSPTVKIKFPAQEGSHLNDPDGRHRTFEVGREEAERMGFQFDPDGNITKVPENEWFLQAKGGEQVDPLRQYAGGRRLREAQWDNAPPSTVSPAKSVSGMGEDGQRVSVKPFNVMVGERIPDSPRHHMAEVTGVVTDPQRPEEVGLQVKVYDPKDPNASRHNLMTRLPGAAFDEAAHPTTLETRTVWIPRDQAKAMNLEGEAARGKYMVMEDQAFQFESNLGLTLADPPSSLGLQRIVDPSYGKVTQIIPTSQVNWASPSSAETARLSLDPKETKLLGGDRVQVTFHYTDLTAQNPTGQKLIRNISRSEARKLGITLGVGGRIRIAEGENSFRIAMGPKTKN